MVGVPFVLVMIFSVFMIEKYEKFSVGLIVIGMLFSSGMLKQCPRIGAYFERKNMNRYGNSLNIVNKKKEGEKNERATIYDDQFSFKRDGWKHSRYY